MEGRVDREHGSSVYPEPDLSKRVVFQKTFHAVKPCKKKNLTSLSEAMSEAMAEVSAQVIRATVQHLVK